MGSTTTLMALTSKFDNVAKAWSRRHCLLRADRSLLL